MAVEPRRTPTRIEWIFSLLNKSTSSVRHSAQLAARPASCIVLYTTLSCIPLLSGRHRKMTLNWSQKSSLMEHDELIDRCWCAGADEKCGDGFSNSNTYVDQCWQLQPPIIVNKRDLSVCVSVDILVVRGKLLNHSWYSKSRRWTLKKKMWKGK